MESNQPNTQVLPSGTRIEEFVIERVLGSGGFGITYLARDTRLDRQVVIKENLPAQFCFRDPHSLTVSPRHTEGEDAENFRWSLESFSKEAATLASLDHPGIVRVLRSFEAFGTAYFVMPYLEGVTLDESIRDREAEGGTFSEPELRGWLGRVLDALAYLHDRGIYHRDIKPGNVLITTDGFPILIDFGSARQRLSERSMTVIESAGYTPFEQLQSRGNVGPWSDLYALGATFHKAITGEATPRANDRVFADPRETLAGRSDSLARYSAILLMSIDRAVAVSVEARWQEARNWLDAIASGGAAARPVDPFKPQELDGLNPPVTVRWYKRPSIDTPVQSISGDMGGDDSSSRSRTNRMRLAQVAIIVASLGASWIWLESRDYPSDGRSVAATLVDTTGSLVITSVPPGAKIKDGSGKVLGVTPVELKELEAGKGLAATLELAGYAAAEIRADVVGGSRKSVPPVELKPDKPKLVVTSDPSGAEVIQFGRVLGTTPWEGDPSVTSTKVSLRLRKLGYEEVEISGEPEPGRSLVLQGSLKALPQKVVVTSDPSGADVLEGMSVVGVTPFSINILPGAKVRYEIRKQGFEMKEVTGVVEPGMELILFARLAGGEELPEPEKVVDIEECRRLAEQGDSSAMWKMGRYYEEGVGVAQDPIQALAWYQKSANEGDPEGIFLLGLCFEFGSGAPVDRDKALQLYKTAMDRGHELAAARHLRLDGKEAPEE